MPDVDHPTPEVRHDPLTGDAVIVAAGRSQRPHSPSLTAPGEADPRDVATCPLCPGRESETPPAVLTLREPGSPDRWSLRVVPNRFPVVGDGAPARVGSGPLLGGRAATGVHEVVVETPDHGERLVDRGPAGAARLLEAFQLRLQALEARPATRHVVAFKNHGAGAGASLTHPHSQITALDFVPPFVRRRTQRARRHYRTHDRCLVCDVVAAEREAGARVVFERDGFIAFAPYAARVEGETLLVPLRHAASFSAAPTDERDRLAGTLLDVLRRVRAALDDPSYNLMLQTAIPRRAGDGAALHWYCRLAPRLTTPAALEYETGLTVNLLPPEDAAALLRRA